MLFTVSYQISDNSDFDFDFDFDSDPYSYTCPDSD